MEDQKYKRPDKLIYAADEKPRSGELIIFALQYVGTAATFLVLPVILAQEAHASVNIETSFISIAMFMVALSAILQSFKRGPIGAGILAPATTNPAYLAASLLAINKGGIALLAGMTIFAGIVEACLAPLIRRMRHLFPPEIAALIIAMIGFELGALGIQDLITPPTNTAAHNQI